MAFSDNLAILVGNLTRDPELRFGQSGTAILTLNVATNHSVKKNDEWEDVPTFHRVIVFGKTAEWLSENVFKGDKIYINGRISNRSYEQDGETKYIHEIIGNTVIPQKKSGGSGSFKKSDSTSADPAWPEGEMDGETINTNEEMIL